MEGTARKGKIVPIFKNLGFIIPKKKNKSKNSEKQGGDSSSTENSPRITDDGSSNSSSASGASLSDVSDSSINDKNKERPGSSTDTKSAPATGEIKEKLDFKKPCSAIFKKICKKPTSESGKTVAKSTSQKPTEKKGTPLSDDQYKDIFDSVIKRYSQEDSSSETELSMDSSKPMSTSDIEKDSNEQSTKDDSDIIPNSIEGAAAPHKSKDENADVEKNQIFAKPTAVTKKPQGFKEVSKSLNPTEKKKESTSAQKSLGPKAFPLVLNTPVHVPKESDSSSSDAEKANKNSENRKNVEKTSKTLISEKLSLMKKSLDENENSNKKTITKGQNLATASASSKNPEKPPEHKYNSEDQEENEGTRYYLDTQKTMWGKDRNIVYDRPPKGKTYKEKMIYLRESRNIGLWIKCCNKDCGKYRYCRDLIDPLEVPKIWTCSMNKDLEFNHCEVPEQRQPCSVEDEVDVIESDYSAGSVVWALVPGHPWWPALVDDDPDVEMFYWINNPSSSTPNSFNVVFFDDKVTRAWVSGNCIESFHPDKNHSNQSTKIRNNKVLADRLKAARVQATAALSMTVPERLEKFGFVARFKGPIREPTLEIDSSNDSEDDSQSKQRNSIETATLSLRSSFHGQRNTRKRKRVLKKKESLKRHKQEMARMKHQPIVSILESQSDEEEEEDSKSDTENLEIDAKEDTDVQAFSGEDEEVDSVEKNDDENEDVEKQEEGKSEANKDNIMQVDNIGVEENDYENCREEEGKPDSNNNERSDAPEDSYSSVNKENETSSHQLEDERHSTSTFFNDCIPTKTFEQVNNEMEKAGHDDEESHPRVEDSKSVSVDNIDEYAVDITNNSNLTTNDDTDAEVRDLGGDDQPKVDEAIDGASEDEDEWSDRSIISDVDSAKVEATNNLDCTDGDAEIKEQQEVVKEKDELEE